MGNEDLLCDAYKEFGYDAIPFEVMRSPESADVAIRCYLLYEAIVNVVNELWDGE